DYRGEGCFPGEQSHMRVFQRVFLAVCALVVLPASSFAATLSKVNDDALAPLRAATVAKKIRLEKLPLYDSKRSVIDLEEFEVWAPEGKIHDHDANGNV